MGVNHNPQMKIAPSEPCHWEEKKKNHDTQQSFKSHNYKLLQVEHNKKTEFYVGKGNVTTQKPTYSFRRIIHELHHGS